MRDDDQSERAANARAARLSYLARRLRNRVLMGKVKLPLLADGQQKLFTLAMKPGVDMRELIVAIEGEPTIAARVLSFANSALYSGRGVTSSVRMAAMRLGGDCLRELLMQAITDARIYRGKDAKALIDERRHAVMVAVTMRRAGELGAVDPDAAFLCGLLHDIGRPIVWQLLREELDEHVDLEARNMLVELLHPVVGERVAKNWALPDAVAEVARLHHCVGGNGVEDEEALDQQKQCRHWAMVRSVAVADRLAHALDEDGEHWRAKFEDDPRWARCLRHMAFGPHGREKWLSHVGRLHELVD